MENEKTRKEIGNHIKKLRVLHGLTQAELAEQLKTSPQNVCRWESSASRIPADIYLEIKKIFKDYKNQMPVDPLDSSTK